MNYLSQQTKPKPKVDS
jgi:Ca2+-binding EF-hand superfamily protein